MAVVDDVIKKLVLGVRIHATVDQEDDEQFLREHEVDHGRRHVSRQLGI